MAEASDAQGMLYQNLVDAGCDRATIQKCIVLFQGNRTGELLRLLSFHRKLLLDAIHCNQKQLDCLDYLVYKTKKESTEE